MKNNNEWNEILNELESHHAIFYKLWSIGRPKFVENIDTAAISFDKFGNYLNFLFNEKFWNALDLNGKLFVVCHEMLHVILNHGIRTKSVSPSNRIASNMALDIVVNHSLISSFGFKREIISKSINYALNQVDENNSADKDQLCWLDTVFPNQDCKSDESFEHYFIKFKKTYNDGMPNMISSLNQGCLDDHEMLSDQDWKNIHDFLSKELSKQELDSIKNFIDKNFISEQNKNNFASNSISNSWVIWEKKNYVQKKKWESVIKKWEKTVLKEVFDYQEQWARVSRRYQNISKKFFISSEVEMYHHDHDDSCDVYFYLDTSGSCWYLKDRFFNAANSLNKSNFKVKLFCFDTQVFETSLESKRIYGGGGTSFSILQEHIENQMREKKIKHPTVFVLTDGYGDSIFLKNPNKWHWFLAEQGTSNYIYKNCKNIYKLENFI